MTFEQQPQLGQFLQILGRNRRHLEAASSLGEHQTLRGEAAQDLAQRADADAVAFLEPVELELLTRPQPAKDDVGADTPITNTSGVMSEADSEQMPCSMQGLGLMSCRIGRQFTF